MSTYGSQFSLMPHGGSRFSSVAAVAVIHCVAFFLLTLSPAREAIINASAMMVTLIQEQPKVAPKPTELLRTSPLKPLVSRSGPIPVPLLATTKIPADISHPPPIPQPPAQPPRTMQTTPAPVISIDPPKFDADYLENPPPVYPRLSKRLAEVGTVMLMVFVDAHGKPGQIDIQSTSRHERLDQAAIDAVRRWRFVAAKQGEKSVAAWVLVPVVFSLRT